MFDTGLYYLQSRYYDPEIGRFINADVFVSTGQGILGCNMYAYCLNNPVNAADSTGMRMTYYDVFGNSCFVDADDIKEFNRNRNGKSSTDSCIGDVFSADNLNTFLNQTIGVAHVELGTAIAKGAHTAKATVEYGNYVRCVGEKAIPIAGALVDFGLQVYVDGEDPLPASLKTGGHLLIAAAIAGTISGGVFVVIAGGIATVALCAVFDEAFDMIYDYVTDDN